MPNHQNQKYIGRVWIKQGITANENIFLDYFYDDFGQVLFVNSPDTGQSEYEYDSAGNLKQKTDAEYTLTEYSYDAMNQLTGIDYPTDTDIAYNYDSPAVIPGIKSASSALSISSLSLHFGHSS
jgi:YD repeat-containing protein